MSAFVILISMLIVGWPTAPLGASLFLCKTSFISSLSRTKPVGRSILNILLSLVSIKLPSPCRMVSLKRRYWTLRNVRDGAYGRLGVDWGAYNDCFKILDSL